MTCAERFLIYLRTIGKKIAKSGGVGVAVTFGGGSSVGVPLGEEVPVGGALTIKV